MHATYYSNERFSAFQTYILPLQYELNLNSFLYLNKIYSNDCCEVKAFEFVSLFNKIYNHRYCQVKPLFVYYLHITPHDYCRVRYELCVLYELKLNFLNPFQALARSS